MSDPVSPEKIALPDKCKMRAQSRYASDEDCTRCGLGEGDVCPEYRSQSDARLATMRSEGEIGVGFELANPTDRDMAALEKLAFDALPAWARDELTTLRSQLSGITEETSALKDVAAERRRQIESEGWTPAHDDEHSQGELAAAAVCYAFTAVRSPHFLGHLWPWDGSWWKPKDKRRNLVKAGALILAEIERLDRAEPTP